MKLFGRKKKESEKKAEKEAEKRMQSEPQEAVLTLYACRKDGEEVPEIAKECFSEVMDRIFYTDEQEFQICFKDGTAICFHVIANSPENKAQSQGMVNFFSQAPVKNEKVKRAALCQIGLFNCIVGISFQLDDNEQRTNYIINTIDRIAGELGGFILHPNMYLYCPDGKLLISIDGKTDFEEFYPQAHTSILERDAQEKEADRDRRAKSIARLKEMGIPYLEHLKAAVFESECRIPDKETVIGRLSAVFAAAVVSEVYAGGQYENSREVADDQMRQLEERYHVSKWLSEEEAEYIRDPEKNPASHCKFGWRYECCSVLMWALSLIELKEPDQICDAAELGAVMWNHTFDSLMEKAVLRSRDEILDMQDLVFRYDWACVDARIHHKELTGLDGEIIVEWHYALNWLTGADGITDWDQVRTTT